MTTFSSLLSSIGESNQPPRQQSSSSVSAPSTTRPKSDAQQPSASANRGVSSTNVSAGIKRKSEEPELALKTKQMKLHQGDPAVHRPPAAGSSRFQLSSKAAAQPKSSTAPPRPSNKLSVSTGPQKNLPQNNVKSATPTTATASPSLSNGVSAGKRGFASIMEKAKAAQDAAKAAGSSGIRHKRVERLTRKERMRAMQEAQAKKAEGSSRKLPADQASKGTASGTPKKGQEISYKGTMKKAAAPLAYRGTMRKVVPGEAENSVRKQKGLAQDKYGGYASWSDLDEAEDEEDYGSEGSSDMDAGYDDLEMEEMSALKAAKKEDQAALEEEERLKREKLERKRKLEQLNKNAAARRKY